MKRILFVLLALVCFAACGQAGSKETAETTAAEAIDPAVVNVYYFHGKQRCKTCVAVGDVAKATVEDAYKGNGNVRFTEINTSEKGNEALVEHYKVTWNALIIDRGGNATDITKQAFATAVNNPETLIELIKKEVDKRL